MNYNSKYLPRHYPFGAGWSLSYCGPEIKAYAQRHCESYSPGQREAYENVVAERVERQMKDIFQKASSAASISNHQITHSDPAKGDIDEEGYRAIYKALFANLAPFINGVRKENSFAAKFNSDNDNALILTWDKEPEADLAIRDFSTAIHLGDAPPPERPSAPPGDDDCAVM